MQSKVHPTYKTKYRVANWPAYNLALVRRGDVTVWVSSEAIRMCRKRPFATGGRGRLQTSPAVCRIPCLILCLADVERVGQCRAPNAPYLALRRSAL